jgi:hypothetical protein
MIGSVFFLIAIVLHVYYYICFLEMNLLLAIVLLQATILLCSEGAAKAPKGTSTTTLYNE